MGELIADDGSVALVEEPYYAIRLAVTAASVAAAAVTKSIQCGWGRFSSAVGCGYDGKTCVLMPVGVRAESAGFEVCLCPASDCFQKNEISPVLDCPGCRESSWQPGRNSFQAFGC